MVFPKTKAGIKKHSKRKRELEISIVIEILEKFLKNRTYSRQKPNILEFGCADGFQIPGLLKIGNVEASDIGTGIRDDIRNMDNVNFTECSITNTPYATNQFDILFSNQVIEHIEDLNQGFGEMKRIGKSDCLYAFTVPTNVWLLLSIPASYLSKFRKHVLKIDKKHKSSRSSVNNNNNNKRKKKRGIFNKLARVISPSGHGVPGEKGFLGCYRYFKIKSWQKLFTDNGFSIIEIHPLLLYAPSSWPIVPTTKKLSRFNVCSSVLFIMNKKE